MNRQKTEEIAQKAFGILQGMISEDFPYLAPLIYEFQGKADEQIKEMGTDGRNMYYDPVFLLQQMKKGKKGYHALRKMYLHMMMHCICGHIWAAKTGDQEDKDLWEKACDIEAEMMRKKLREPSAQEQDTGMNAFHQEILGIQNITKLQTDFEKKKTEIAGAARFLDPTDMVAISRRNQAFRKTMQAAGRLCKKDDHSCWWRKEKKSRKNGNLPGQGCKAVVSVPGSSGGEAEGNPQSSRERWQELMRDMQSFLPEELRRDLFYGNLPGCGGTMVHASAENDSDYQELLRRYIEVKEKVREDLESLDTGWYTLGLELYGNIPIIEYPESSEQPAADHIVIAVDVSGSCGGETASRFLRETCNLLRDMDISENNVHIRIMECDTEIQRETVIHGKDDIPDLEHREVRGFGGTDFRPVFQRIRKLRETGEMDRVRCLLFLSDGCGNYPKRKPDYDVIFVLNEPGAEEMMPSWVQKVYLTEHELKEEWT